LEIIKTENPMKAKLDPRYAGILRRVTMRKNKVPMPLVSKVRETSIIFVPTRLFINKGIRIVAGNIAKKWSRPTKKLPFFPK